MKKLLSVLLIAFMATTLVACSSKTEETATTEEVKEEEPVVEENADIIGIWVEDHGDTDEYDFLTFDEDGSGSLLHADLFIGLPLEYEVNGNEITTHMATVEDTTMMAYDPTNNVIVYDGDNYTRIDATLAKVVDVWVTEANDNGEYMKLVVEPDATGYDLTMPLEIGTPLRFVVNADGSIDVEEGSPDFVSPLTYDEVNDTVTFENLTYTRKK